TSLTVSNCTIVGNVAQGGAGGTGGSGGNGLGGGLNLSADTDTTLQGTLVADNQADGGSAGAGGAAGAGIGGGVYNLGTFASNITTVIAHNKAATSSADPFGV